MELNGKVVVVTGAARGWTREGGDLYDVLARLDEEGCARYVVTDVNKDGMLQGPNLDLLRDVCARTDRPVVASGGITELADLESLPKPADPSPESIVALLEERGLQYTTWEGWEKLDAHEIALGAPHDRARIKVVPREGMLEASRG